MAAIRHKNRVDERVREVVEALRQSIDWEYTRRLKLPEP